MRKTVLLSLGTVGVLACAMAASAQLPAEIGVSVVFDGTAVDSVNGGTDPGPAEFDTVAVKPDGATIYLFDSIGTMDGIIARTAGVSTVFAAENELTAGSASAGDLDADATNVYTSIYDGTKQRIWRIPHAGFGGAAELVDSSGSLTVLMNQITVDAKNSRLIIAYNDAFGAVTENIVHAPLNATNATPTLLTTEADIEVVLATLAGYADDTLDDLNVYDMAVQSTGDVIFSHGFNSARQVNGSLLKVTESGAISVFRTADDIITAAGADTSLVNIGSLNVEVLSDDQVLILAYFSSDNVILEPFMAVVSADGTSQVQIGTQTDFFNGLGTTVTDVLVPGGQTLFRFDNKDAGDVDAADDFYFFRQGSPSSSAPAAQHAVIKVTGIQAFLAGPTAVKLWSVY